MTVYFVGVDVGTGSARAGLFDQTGKLIKHSAQPVKVFNPLANYYEQSSQDIWEACCKAVKEATEDIDPSLVEGIGFDATCSLVALDKEDKPITVSPTGNDEHNVILWMDHRASEQTDLINAINHAAFKYVGGKVSIEMQLPKLLWLKRNIPKTWKKSNRFMDLPDFLTWKATNDDSRSQCSVVCKWSYVVDESGNKSWPQDLLELLDLDELLDDNSSIIGSKINIPGGAQGSGLSKNAAQELGLNAGIAVGVSLIDAYAGALGLLACHADVPLEQRMALICGTSTCHMMSIPRPLFVPGVWGPYSDVLLPGTWLLEGGQSATGKLLDHVVETHPSYPVLKARLEETTSIPEELSRILHAMARSANCPVAHLAKNIHVWPDFHGNRSPLADPNLKGMICGLTLDGSVENLALMYLATIQALCYGTRHIISVMGEREARVGCLLACGGLTKIDLFNTTMADAVGLPVVIPYKKESVLLGSAMLGASASGRFASLTETMAEMGGHGRSVQPNMQDREFHDRKYRAFLKMLDDQREYFNIMNSSW